MKKTTPLNTLTVMFRNVIEEFPPEYNFTKIGDLFIWVLLSDYGKGKYLSCIKPTRYRVHNGGIFSKVNRKQRRFMRFTLDSALVSYYKNNNNEERKLSNKNE